MKKEARFWKIISKDKVQCYLCMHKCKILNNKTGICGVRTFEDDKLFTLIYGTCSSMAADPIEKKPLYHFFPGTNAFSMGTIGCNFKCMHCQNYSISTASKDYPYIKEITPNDSVKFAKDFKCKGIAYTYNEPTLWHEFSYDSAKIAKDNDLYTVYVTNGYMSEDALIEISPFLDAMNIDVKAFDESFYKKVCKAKLQPVLNTCILANELDIHIELTYLIIPGYNDSIEEIKKFLRWVIDNLGYDVPVHFSRFHPDYNMTNVSTTPMDTMIKIYNLAKKEGLFFPYLGNVFHGDYENTKCPKCGNICIERNGFNVDMKNIKDGKCSKCGFQILKN